jgi:hypothetical protein
VRPLLLLLLLLLLLYDVLLLLHDQLLPLHLKLQRSDAVLCTAAAAGNHSTMKFTPKGAIMGGRKQHAARNSVRDVGPGRYTVC